MTAPAAPRFALRWERREPPLPAVAVLGLGPCTSALGAATRERLLAGAQLRAVATTASTPDADTDADALVVLGEAAELPWADGVRYLGRDGGILVPTTLRPWPSAALWREALTPATGADRAMLTVLLPDRVLSAELPARTADPAALPGLPDAHLPDVSSESLPRLP